MCVDADYGFTINYPTAWDVAEVTGEPDDIGATTLFSAGMAPYGDPGVSVYVLDVVAGQTLTDMIVASTALTADWADLVAGDEVATTTRDGSAATFVTYTRAWTDDWGTYPGANAQLQVEKDGEYITINVSAGDTAGWTAEQIEEVVRTLAFN